MKNLDFPYPFSGWSGLDLPCCFAALHMFFEERDGKRPKGRDEYDCPKLRGEPCDSCCNCGDELKMRHGRLWMTFDTVVGRTAAVTGFGGEKTGIFNEIFNSDDSLDFLMGFAGYDYAAYEDDIAGKIAASIDGGVPVLARVEGEWNAFRVITGYDGDAFFPAERMYDNHKKGLKGTNLSSGDIKKIYIVTGKADRSLTPLDALKRIRRVMEADRANGEWDKYISAFTDYWGNLQEVTIEDLKQKFKSLQKGMIFNCHSFSHAAGLWSGLNDPVFKPALDRMFKACDLSHGHQWQGVSLYDTRDWSKKFYNEAEWGMCENAINVLRMVKADDEMIYGAVCEIVDILENDSVYKQTALNRLVETLGSAP